MEAGELLDLLKALPEAQFEEVRVRTGIPASALPSGQSEQALRAIRLLDHFQQPGRSMVPLTIAIGEVTGRFVRQRLGHASLPQPLGEAFTGRAQDTEELHKTLSGEGAVALIGNRALSVHGGGGIGKTRLAIEYAWSHLADYPGGVFYTVVLSRHPVAVWAELGRLLRPEIVKDEEAADVARKHLEEARERILVVLDDVSVTADSPANRFARPMTLGGNSRAALPAGPGVRVLITTRHRNLPGTRPMEVARLDDEAATALLLRQARRRPAPAEHQEATALAASDLGGHPLAISLAGAYLAKALSLTFASYRGRLNQDGIIQTLERAAEHAGVTLDDYDRPIARTYELSVAVLDPRAPVERLALSMQAVAAELAAGVAIDRPLLYRIAGQLSHESSEAVDLALDRLLGLSLLSPAADPFTGIADSAVVLHALMADYTRWKNESLGDPNGPERRRATLEVLNSLFPDFAHDYWKILSPTPHSGWDPFLEHRQLHTDAAWERIRSREQPLEVARLGRNLGKVSERQGDLEGALEAFRASLAICQRLASADPSDATAQRDLSISHDKVGDVRLEQGDLESALEAFLASRAICQRLANADPSDATAQRDLSISHNRVGNVRREQGDLEGALEGFRASLTIRQRLASADPSDTTAQRDLSISHDRVGDVRREQGDLEGALEAFLASRAICQRLASADPSDATAQRDLSISHNRVGNVRREQGDLEGALEGFRASLAIRQRLASADPSDATAQRDLSISHENVGDVRREQGDLEGALEAFLASRAICQRLASADPSDATAQRDLSISHNRVGNVRREQGDLEGALEGFRVSLAIRQRLASVDPSNATVQRDLSVSHENVGGVRQKQGDLEGALKAFRASLAICQRLASADPSNATVQRDVAAACWKIYSAGAAQTNEGRREVRVLLKMGLSILRRLQSQGRLAPASASWIPDFEAALDEVGNLDGEDTTS